MKMTALFVLLFVSTCVTRAEDWTIQGKTFHNVQVGTVEADRVHITYDGGLGTVNLADMPPDLQKRFGYDPAKAAALSASRLRLAAASDAVVAQTEARQHEADQRELATEQATNRAAAFAGAQADANKARADRIAWLESDIDEKTRLLEDEWRSDPYGKHTRGGYKDIIDADERELRSLGVTHYVAH